MRKVLQKIALRRERERRLIHLYRDEINKKNYDTVTILAFGYIVILSSSLISSFFMDFHDDAGFSRLRYAYIGLIIIAIIFYAYLMMTKDRSSKNATVIIYITNSLAVVYSFIVSAFVNPDNFTVTYITIIFIAATLYIDLSIRINCFIVSSLFIFIFAISFFKGPQYFNGEIVNNTTVSAVAMLVGHVVRSARFENLSIRSELLNQAYSDKLTGISNRRRLFEDLAASAASDKTKGITAISILDIDFFKYYNDYYGHQQGDMCLRTLGECFLSLEKQYNIRFYRYGGEEFVINYYGASANVVSDVLNTLQQKIHSLQIEHITAPLQVVSVSIGTSFTDEKNYNKFETVLSQADIALYKAKANGRNRSEFYDLCDPPPANIKTKVRERDKK